MAAAQEVAETHRFVRALFARPSPFTFLFFGINVGVFVLMWLAGGMGTMWADQEVLTGFGAKDNQLILQQHQYWRLVTSMFLHIGFLHIFFNNYALWIVGQEIERLYGSARFVFLYLATGVAGSLASFLFNPHATSAGASGALFGLFGVLGVFAFRYRREIPEAIAREIKRRVLPLILINLVIGFSVNGIDNSAHIGGLLTGAALCMVVPFMRPEEKSGDARNLWRVLQVASLIVIALSFGAAFKSYDGPPPRFSNLTGPVGVEAYLKAMTDADNAVRSSFGSLRQIVTRRDETADATKSLGAVNRGLEAINKAPNRGEQPERFRKELLEVLTQQKAIIERFNQTRPHDWTRIITDETEAAAAYRRFLDEFEPWFAGYANRNGYEVKPVEPGK
jgi:membrane associated rhomboid family serine protease